MTYKGNFLGFQEIIHIHQSMFNEMYLNQINVFFSKINKQININIILSANGLDKNNNTFSMKKQIILKIKM